MSRRGRRIAAVIAVVAALVAALVYARRARSAADGVTDRATIGVFTRTVRAPAGVRIRVQVLNATRTRGLARRATMLLRDRGFDVVEVGTTAARGDSTLVLDRSGHPEWAALVATVMGGAQVQARPDSSRYLDISVLIGPSWRPPAEPLYP